MTLLPVLSPERARALVSRFHSMRSLMRSSRSGGTVGGVNWLIASLAGSSPVKMRDQSLLSAVSAFTPPLVFR